MSKALERNENINTGITIIDKKRYGNIEEVTHRFSGDLSVEQAVRDLIITELEDSKIGN